MLSGAAVLRSWWWVTLLVIPMLVVLHPAVIRWAGRMGSAVLRRPIELPLLTLGAVLRAAAWAFGGQVLLGLQYYLLLGMVSGNWHDPLLAIGLFQLATSAGILVVFAAAGAGPRELILVAGSAAVVGQGPALLAVLLSRAVLTVGDFLLAGIGWLLGRRHRRERSPTRRSAPWPTQPSARISHDRSVRRPGRAHRRVRHLSSSRTTPGCGCSPRDWPLTDTRSPRSTSRLGLSTADRVRVLRQPWRLPLLFGHLVRCWWRLWRRGRAVRGHVDAVLVGYLGHFDVHLARRVFGAVPILLDHLIFAAGTAVDRGVSPGVRTRILARLDRSAMKAADVIIVDTQEHAEQVPADLADRVVTCLVGADSSWFAARRQHVEEAAEGPLRVIFFGLFTPLQGTPVIAQALAELGDRNDVQVTMVGHGQDYQTVSRTGSEHGAGDLGHWVLAADLPALVAEHDVVLGIFGTTPKAARVVPNKVYQGAGGRLRPDHLGHPGAATGARRCRPIRARR